MFKVVMIEAWCYDSGGCLRTLVCWRRR